MQDTTEQRVGASPSQKTNRRKESGSSDENICTRKIKLQTSFPPIHLSLISNAKPLDKKLKDYASNSDLSRHTWGEKINLPQVENSERPPKSAKLFPDKSKYPKDFGCNVSNLGSTSTFSFEGQKDSKLEKQTWLEIPVPKTTSDRLSPEISKVPECQSCRNEKRIRSSYDKILLQTKKEKEALQMKVSELEAELRRQENISKEAKEEEDVTINLVQPHNECYTTERLEENNHQNKYDIIWEKYKKMEKCDKAKQEKIDCLLAEIEKLNTTLNSRLHSERNQEQLFNSTKSKLVSDMEEVKSQLEKVKEREMLNVSNFEREKVEILTQLETANIELEKLKKRRPLVIAELRKERDCSLLEIERLKTYAEKVKTENASLSETIRVLQQELEKRSMSSCISPQMYTARADVLLISHQSFSENTRTGAADYTLSEICSCGRTLPNSATSDKCAMTQVEEDVMAKEIFRQMKRERNLLLDFMVIMYERRWFVEEAIPYVRRALRKCGALSVHTE